MAGKKRVAAGHGRAADGVLDPVGFHVDTAILKEEPDAMLAPQQVCEALTEVGCPRDACGLGGQLGEDLIYQRSRQVLTDRTAMIGG